MIICSSVYFVVLLLTVHFYHSTMFFITAYLGKPFSVPSQGRHCMTKD
uniref:Uncharacterized protein n=1 Tax=Anguilla anguilla TaxID=7936 RepID=A0A0E9S201_ANGAN